jgi:hypothetical protein
MLYITYRRGLIAVCLCVLFMGDAVIHRPLRITLQYVGLKMNGVAQILKVALSSP